MTPAYAALLQADVALALFQAGQDEEAFRIAAQAVRGSPSHAQAAFVAGLAAWVEAAGGGAITLRANNGTLTAGTLAGGAVTPRSDQVIRGRVVLGRARSQHDVLDLARMRASTGISPAASAAG